LPKIDENSRARYLLATRLGKDNQPAPRRGISKSGCALPATGPLAAFPHLIERLSWSGNWGPPHSQDPLPAGSVYAAVIDAEANVGLYRVEVNALPGSGKLKSPASMERNLKESLQRAFSYVQANQDKMGLTSSIAQKDLTVEAVELTGGKVESGCGVPFFIAMMSAIHDRPVDAGMVILGDLTIQGNIKGLSSILEPLQVAVDNGASRALVPIANKNQFAALSEDVVENLELVFYGDPDRALRRALAN